MHNDHTNTTTREQWEAEAERKKIAELRKGVCMKLVEILARELDMWPYDSGHYDVKYLTQDENGIIMSWEDDGPLYFDEEKWNIKGSLPVDAGLVTREERASDYSTSTVTREQWEAERKRIAEPPAWNGEGLPPVGTVCEAWYDTGRECWHKAVVFGSHPLHANCMAVAAEIGNTPYKLIWCDHFRPIQSDREKWIDAAIKATDLDREDAERALCEIYDAGLAKLPENKGKGVDDTPV